MLNCKNRFLNVKVLDGHHRWKYAIEHKSNVIGLVDEAWNKRGTGKLASNGYVTYDVDMGKTIGTNGETFIRIVTNGNTNKLISAYPIPQKMKRR